MKIFYSIIYLTSLPLIASNLIEIHPCLTVEQAFDKPAVAAQYSDEAKLEADCGPSSTIHFVNKPGCCRLTDGTDIEYDYGGKDQNFAAAQVCLFLILSFILLY